ncbi:MAG: radical SAM protein [Planctomycetes bacterium]|nr:radical SAM protein [Planctomycetota bacterium]
MDHLLLHPPFADPTQPYLSLPTLKGHLRALGLDARVVDVNLAAACWLLDPETIADVGRRLGARFSHLNGRYQLDLEEQREYLALAEARPKLERILGASPAPLDVFRTRERFFDAATYTHARRQVEDYFDALSAAHWPFRFGFNTASHGVAPWSFDLLERYEAERRSPLVSFYEEFLISAAEWDWDRPEGPPCDVSEAAFVGISIVFPSQVPEALCLARAVKRRAPQAFVALGGPAIHQVAIHLDDGRRRRLLEWCDGLGVFEGEATLAALLPRLDAWRNAPDPGARFALLCDVPNLMLAEPSGTATHTGPRWSLDLREAAMPDYSDLDLDAYLAPSRTLLYAPTRGCYWGQCSFCYYGLAETATASYREIPPERAASELGQLARRYGVRNVYLSCDVLSPKYALRLADALIEKGVKIRWSSDLKIEKYFTPERCARLFEAGLRSAAFGIESGSDRILDLMRKGCDRATMTAVNRAFHEAGVATEWMTFTDHPDETVEEALSTVAWIAEEEDAIDLFLVGQFGLEAGSHVAQDPARYGVRRVYHAAGDDLRLYALFDTARGPRSRDAQQRVDAAIGELAARWELHPYPWAGAISTHHTFLHFLEFGPRAFRSHFQRAPQAVHGPLPPPPVSHIAGLRERARFDLGRMAENERAFLSDYLPGALRAVARGRRGFGEPQSGPAAPLSVEDYDRAAALGPKLYRGD